MTANQYNRLCALNLKCAENISLTHEEIIERNELQFLENKQCLDFSLRGDSKYYYAANCAEFCKFIEANGAKGYTPDDIQKCYICFSQYYGGSIRATLSGGGVTIIKSFNDKLPMLEYIVGHNEARLYMKNRGA